MIPMRFCGARGSSWSSSANLESLCALRSLLLCCRFSPSARRLSLERRRRRRRRWTDGRRKVSTIIFTFLLLLATFFYRRNLAKLKEKVKKLKKLKMKWFWRLSMVGGGRGGGKSKNQQIFYIWYSVCRLTRCQRLIKNVYFIFG